MVAGQVLWSCADNEEDRPSLSWLPEQRAVLDTIARLREERRD